MCNIYTSAEPFVSAPICSCSHQQHWLRLQQASPGRTETHRGVLVWAWPGEVTTVEKAA